MQLWFVLATAVVLLWGIDGILAKLSAPKLGIVRIAVLIAVVDGLVYFLGFYYWRDNMSIAFGDAALALISCIIGGIAYLSYYESITDGQIAIAGTISAAYPALTVIGALVLLSETLTMIQVISLVAIVGGVVGLSYEPNPGSERAMPRRSLLFALLAFVLFGVWGLTSKMAINAVGPGNIFGFYVVSSLLVSFVYVLLRRVRPERSRACDPPITAWVAGGAALALNVCAVFAFSFALKTGSASLVVPISSAYPLVTVVLAVALLHEKLSRLHVVALVFVIAGLTLIGAAG